MNLKILAVAFLLGLGVGMIISGAVCQIDYDHADNEYKEMYQECRDNMAARCPGGIINVTAQY